MHSKYFHKFHFYQAWAKYSIRLFDSRVIKYLLNYSGVAISTVLAWPQQPKWPTDQPSYIEMEMEMVTWSVTWSHDRLRGHMVGQLVGHIVGHSTSYKLNFKYIDRVPSFCGTYCHKTGTRPLSCVTSRQPTLESRFLFHIESKQILRSFLFWS